VRIVESIEQATNPASVTILAGQTINLTSTGLWELAAATSAGALGLRTAVATHNAVAYEALTGLYKGILDLGIASSDFQALAFDAAVYASDTAGGLDTAAGTVTRIVGTVTPGWANTTADKLLRVDL
jgi:hypothetical protein